MQCRSRRWVPRRSAPGKAETPSVEPPSLVKSPGEAELPQLAQAAVLLGAKRAAVDDMCATEREGLACHEGACQEGVSAICETPLEASDLKGGVAMLGVSTSTPQFFNIAAEDFTAEENEFFPDISSIKLTGWVQQFDIAADGDLQTDRCCTPELE